MLPAQGAPVRTRTASDLLAFYGVRMTPETEGLLTALREARRLLLITTRDATDKDTQKLKLVEHEAYANGLQKNVFDVVR